MSTLWRRSDAVVTRRIAGETLLVPVRGNLADLERLFLLNETGAAVWESLDGATALDAIAARLAAEYEVEPDAARADAEELVAGLAAAGLVESAGEAPCAPA